MLRLEPAGNAQPAAVDQTTEPTVQSLLQEREITYRNLLAAYLRLQEVNRQKTVFLASAAHELKTPLAVIKSYYDLLLPHCRHVDIWHTHYNHIIEYHQGVVEWFKGSGMRPFLAPLSEASRKTFLAKYSEEIRRAYRACLDGKVLLRFPRLFMVAAR